MVIGMIDRAHLLSHPRYHEENLCQVIKILLNNDYPLKFMFEIVQRLKYHSTKNKNVIIDNGKNKDPISHWFTLSYILRISDKIKTTIIDLGTKVSCFSLNKLGNIKG